MKEYSLEFDERALREWDALDGSVRKKLIWNPHPRGNEFHRDLTGFYKIKLLKRLLKSLDPCSLRLLTTPQNQRDSTSRPTE